VSGQASAVGVGRDPRTPVGDRVASRSIYLLVASWVLLLEGALTLIFLPILVLTAEENIARADISLFAAAGVVCLVGGGLIYVPRAWTWWVAVAAALGAALYLAGTGGLASPREAYIAVGLSAIALVLLLLGRAAAGHTDALSLASARIPFRLKVTLVWIAVFFMIGIFLALSDLDLDFIREKFRFIAFGLEFTILLATGAIILATVLALIGALGRLSRNPVAYGVSGFYTSFFRGTPLIVQLFLIYLALPQIGQNMGRPSIVKILALDAFVAGVIGLGLNYGAYMTEIFRAGIQSVGHGQAEAADALGMSYAQRMRRVVLPQAARVIIPPTGNEFIAMMKDTALVGLLAGQPARAELFQRATLAYSDSLRNRLEALIVAAALYWALTSIFTFFQARLERRISKGYVRTEVRTAAGRKRAQFIPAPASTGGSVLTIDDVDEAPT
jgi:polar amino acid transport system permease protein